MWEQRSFVLLQVQNSGTVTPNDATLQMCVSSKRELGSGIS